MGIDISINGEGEAKAVRVGQERHINNELTQIANEEQGDGDMPQLPEAT